MSQRGAQAQITAEISRWDEIAVRPHRFGGVEYAIGRREIGHIHGDAQVDIPFPKKVRDQLIADGRAQPHHILPQSGWITFYLRRPEDVAAAIALLAESYALARQQKRKRKS